MNKNIAVTKTIELRKSGLSYSEIAKHVEKSISWVSFTLQQNNCTTKNPSIEEFQVYIYQIKEMYASGMSTPEISKTIGKNPGGIRNILRKNGVNIRKNTEACKKYNFNESFFDIIDNEEKAYWLGFVAADGCVHKRKGKLSPVIKLTLSNKDKDHIAKFRKSISSNHTITDGSNFNEKRNINYYSSSLTLPSLHMFESLATYGVIPNKTLIIEFPKIAHELIHHYIRGYYDGDGCIYFTKKGTAVFSITSNRKIINQIQDILVEQCNLKKTKLLYKHKNSNAGAMSYVGNIQVKRIVEYLYKDATIFLDRKYEKLKHML